MEEDYGFSLGIWSVLEAIDVAVWTEATGIYFLSQRKYGMCLAIGVTADRVVTDRRGIRVREITFCGRAIFLSVNLASSN
jgi:hypothetical protein